MIPLTSAIRTRRSQFRASGVLPLSQPVKTKRPKTTREAQVPSPAHLPKKRSSVGALGLLDVRAGREIARLADGRVDGLAQIRAAIDQIKAIKAADPAKRCIVAFDLDNTLFDTRTRTLAALQAFDAANHPPTHWFDDVPLAKVGWDATETCANLGLPAELATKAQAYWDVAFWSGDHFLADRLMESVAELLVEAQNAKAEIYYLSGRIDSLRGPTEGQLLAAGLPLPSPDRLVLKKDLDTKTSPFKADWLFEQESAGAFIGFFLTDSGREIADIMALEKARGRECKLPCILADHPLKRAGVGLEETPVVLGVAARTRCLQGTS